MYEEVKEEIKACEGYVNKIYKCTEGFDTIFYGHKITPEDDYEHGIEYTKAEGEAVFEKDFQIACDDAENFIPEQNVNPIAFGIVIEMCFQLGKPRVMKFKKMWQALRDGDPQTASAEILDSQWHKQTPGRCEEVAEEMAGSTL